MKGELSMFDGGVEEGRDRTDELAGRLGREPRELADAIGTHWRRHELTPDDLETVRGWVTHDDPRLRELAHAVDEGTDWYLAGDPALVMLGLRGADVVVARPVGEWLHGTHGLAHLPGVVAVVDAQHLTALGEQVEAVVASRRRSLRMCRYCRRLVPPEHRYAQDVCHDCATRWSGVVY
jgi:hypothetical protein